MKPWDQQPAEPDMWFERFTKYFLPAGDLTSAYYEYYAQEVSEDGRHPDRAGYTTTWKNAYDKYEWEERAAAWRRERFEASLEDSHKKIEERLSEDVRAIEWIKAIAVDALTDPDVFKKDPALAVRAFKMMKEMEEEYADHSNIEKEVRNLSDSDLDELLAQHLRNWEFEQEPERETPAGDTGGEASGEDQAIIADRLARFVGVPAQASGVRQQRSESPAEKLASEHAESDSS